MDYIPEMLSAKNRQKESFKVKIRPIYSKAHERGRVAAATITIGLLLVWGSFLRFSLFMTITFT
jgi:hypothetical protein